MAEGDIGRFEFDFDNTYGSFVLNENAQVYLRYGGRTDQSAEAFVNIPGFTRALEKGIALHESWKAGELDLPPAGAPRSSRDYPMVDELASAGRCIHCHDVASARADELFAAPDFDKTKDLWLYPNPWMLGLVLDPEDGNLITSAEVTAAKAGLKAGERIVGINGFPTSTFTDIQYRLHQLTSDTTSIPIDLEGGKVIDLPLPGAWRATDLTRRRIGQRLSPNPGFGVMPLSPERRSELGLPEYGLAGSVYFDDADGSNTGDLRGGDIITAIDGIKESPLTSNAALYLQLTYEPGDRVKIDFLRRGEPGATEVTPLERPQGHLRGRRGRMGGRR